MSTPSQTSAAPRQRIVVNTRPIDRHPVLELDGQEYRGQQLSIEQQGELLPEVAQALDGARNLGDQAGVREALATLRTFFDALQLPTAQIFQLDLATVVEIGIGFFMAYWQPRTSDSAASSPATPGSTKSESKPKR